MPHINVKMYAGKSEEEKQAIALALINAYKKVTNCNDSALSLTIEDIESEEWMQKVFVPEIANKANLLYKKPGYGNL